jgi:nicotinic acid mononucleotide adenylyltransferase
MAEAAAEVPPVYPLEKTKESAVFSFGRFQPPTTGHALLIDKVIQEAKESNSDPIIFVSSTENNPSYLKSSKRAEMLESGVFQSTKANENPLPVSVKVDVLKKQHAGKSVQFINTTLCNCRNILQIIPVLLGNGYTKITMMVGSDRVETFQKLFSERFPEVEVKGLERVAAAANARSMSGTKLRTAAVKGEVDAFVENVVMGSYTKEEAVELLNMIRTQLGYPVMEGGRRKRQTRRVKRRKTRKLR